MASSPLSSCLSKSNSVPAPILARTDEVIAGVGFKPQLGRCQQSTASIQNNSDLTQGPAGCSAAG
jgi:hypothetical protein